MKQQWRNRVRGGISHLFIDGVGACIHARVPPGTPSPYQGRPFREFEDIEVNRHGMPSHGSVCELCIKHFRHETPMKTKSLRNCTMADVLTLPNESVELDVNDVWDEINASEESED